MRSKFIPTKDEWSECFRMLCEHCGNMPGCEVVEQMIDAKSGGDWPPGGWVTDPGASTTCLSYTPRQRRAMTDIDLQTALDSAVPMCDGCAARKGSEASTALHTQRDFKASVKSKCLFTCHKPENKGFPCGGWAQAIKKGDS